MTWNFRIMRRYQKESPDTYWYEIVECYYGDDGVPMMWCDVHLPAVDAFDIEIEEVKPEFKLEDFVKDSLLDQYTMFLRDIDSRGPILDERDFELGGVYADHPDAKELEGYIEEIRAGGFMKGDKFNE